MNVLLLLAGTYTCGYVSAQNVLAKPVKTEQHARISRPPTQPRRGGQPSMHAPSTSDGVLEQAWHPVWPEPLKPSGSYFDTSPKASDKVPEPVKQAAPVEPKNQPANEYERPTVIVRMTGYMEDFSITPKINLDAMNMANEFLRSDKPKNVVILLERVGVKLAAGSCAEMSVDGNLVDFRKLLKNFIAANGKVVLNKKWADEFGVQQCDLIAGPQIVSEQDVALLITDAEKIVDYATPNYPVNTQVWNGMRNAPPPSSYKK